MSEQAELLIAEVQLQPNVFKVFSRGNVINLKATNRRLSWSRPTSFLNIFPIGQQTVEIPLRQIAAVAVRQKVNVSSVLLIAFGIVMIMGLVGIPMIILGIRRLKETALAVTTTGGTMDYLAIPASDMYILSEFARALQDALSEI